MSVSKQGKVVSHSIQIQPAISYRSFSVKQLSTRADTACYQIPLNELLVDIEDFSYETMLPTMLNIQSTGTDKQ